MKEIILIFNVLEREKKLKIEKALFPLKIKIKYVKIEDYSQPLGVLAGISDLKPADLPFEGKELPNTMFVFAFLSQNQLNQVLAALRKSQAGPFPYKAVLTPTNQYWTAHECFDKICKEHEEMKKMSR